MSDHYIEKSLIGLIILSLLLHVGAFVALLNLPGPKELPKEPVFIDLQQAPETGSQAMPSQNEIRRQSDSHVRVPREMAPRGDSAHDSQPASVPRQQMPRQEPVARSQPVPPAANRQQPQIAPGSSMTSLLKPKAQTAPGQQGQITQQKLFPGVNRLAKLEEAYRRKFENDVAEGDTRFLNSDDIVFGSFLRRFESAVYGVWRYPQEAALKGIEGIVPVRITFNRRGEISNIQQLESSGAKILDEEVLRTLRAIGPMGAFPKGYDKDEFHLIAFFQYGGTRKSIR